MKFEKLLKKTLKETPKEVLRKIATEKQQHTGKLDLSLSELTTIPEEISALVHLKELNLTWNQLSDARGLENLIHLQRLDLGCNQLSDYRFLENLTKLQYLNLSDNQLSDCCFLENLTHLQTLYLSDNQLSDCCFLENLTRLQHLYLENNQICQIDTLENLTNLKTVDLRNNKIEVLPSWVVNRHFEVKYEKVFTFGLMNFYGNPITHPPLEIVKKGHNAIKQQFIDDANSSEKIKTILFLSANPKAEVSLRLGEELRKIKDSLAGATNRNQFKLESESAVQIPTITKAMQKQNPEIVHFSGHGTGKEGIIVENPVGEAVFFPTQGLNRLFESFKDTVKCVVLNACFSTEQAQVISEHGIYVVGMNKEVGDKAAIDFAVGFYQSLGEGNDFKFAFKMALVNNSANLKDANTPELWFNGNKLKT